MAKVERWNDLLYQINLRAFADERKSIGRVPLDLRFKAYENTTTIWASKASQTDGNHEDIKYLPDKIYSWPYCHYDACIDPIILKEVKNRNQLVNVSGH